MSKTITLSSSKTIISRIGYGTGTKWASRDNTKPIDQNLVQSIHAALSIDYRHFDTAEGYGTETSLSEAIHTQLIPRNELFITSKVYRSIENIQQACLKVLTRLNIDYLDLWLIHAPFYDRTKTSLEQAWKQMENLVENKKVKAIGVSNFQKEHLEELLSFNPKIKPAVNQIELHPYVYKASKDLIKYCKSNEIVIEAYAPLGSMIYRPDGPVDEIVQKLAVKYKRSSAQILLKWNISKGDIVITTSSKRERLEDFIKVLDEDFELSDQDINAIDEAGAKLHFRRYIVKDIDGKTQD